MLQDKNIKVHLNCSLRSKRFRLVSFGAKKDRGRGLSVLTVREMKRELFYLRHFSRGL